MKRHLPSTSVRLALVVMGLFLLGYVAIGASVYWGVTTLLRHDVHELVRSDAVTLVDIVREDGFAALSEELQARIHDNGDPDAVYALRDGQGVDRIGRMPAMPAVGPHGLWVEFPEQVPGTQRPLRVVAFVQALQDGSLLLTGQRLQAQDRLIRLMQKAALLVFVVALMTGAVLGWLTSRWVSRRLRNLDATVARIAAGELGLRASLDHSGDAFDQVAQRFNGMLDRIEALLDGVRHATNHIAHDLRTPLTRLRNRLEGLRDGVRSDEQMQRLNNAIRETDQLLQVFSALLRLARIESSAMLEQVDLLRLDALVDDAIEMYAPMASERGIAIQTQLAEVRLRGDRDQLFQLVVNLLDNAMKYAPTGSALNVCLEVVEKEACLQISDSGPGIPEADRERVFDRFQRLEAHRGSPGFGLGLSLVRAIAHHHGGRVLLQDNAPGLRVLVMLPLP